MNDFYANVVKFSKLFSGRTDAFGTGRGQWIKRSLEILDFEKHLRGEGPGLGVAPLLDNGTVNFAAIDLDEPDFDAAREMQDFIPGSSFVERSRSGNAHVWVFFSDPIDAWIVRGILKEATLAAGKTGVEIFPKQDKLREGMLGNYINLPYHGKDRPILPDDFDELDRPLEKFLEDACANRNSPEDWKKRAGWLQIDPPELRGKTSEFGTQKELHICAEWIIAGRDDRPLSEGHRNAVLFALAKMLCNYEGFDHDECLENMRLVNESADDPESDSEVIRILANAEKGQYTSTDCDSPLVEPFAHPNCPIAHPRNK